MWRGRLDRDVDLSDLSSLATSYGAKHASVNWSDGDFDRDDDVDLNDLSALAGNYALGEALAFADFASLASVFEPVYATVVLGVAGAMIRRRA